MLRDLNRPAVKVDPGPVLRDILVAGPVIRVKAPMMGKLWLATGHAAASDLLKDNRTFVMEAVSAGLSKDTRLRWWMPKAIDVLMSNMLMRDEPNHRRLRRLVDQAFSRRGLEGMEESVTRIANRLIDGFPPGRVDLVPALARELPLSVICELLGLPQGDRPLFRAAFAPLARGANPLGMFLAIRGMGRILDYLRDRFALVRAAPDDSLISALVAAEAEGERLSEDELLAMVFLLFVAGHETTTHLISGGYLALLQHPGAAAEVQADPSLMPGAVEEMLRHVSPVQMTKPRFVAQDTVFHGQALKRGETIAALIASANRDAAVFDRPDVFDIHRRPNLHLSFSVGVHFCLGLQLARMEARVALQTLLERWPDGVHLDRAVYGKRLGLRGLNRLEVTPR